MHGIMNIFTKEKTDKVQTITTLEIAEMMDIEHWKVLRKLDGRKENGKHIKGYVEVLTDNQMVVSEYFYLSTYKDSSGKENRCYNVTKLGCDFLANKFTGEKGILFTARYVKRFNEMENCIKQEYNVNVENSKFMMCLQGLKFLADDMKIAESSRLFMYNGAFEEFGLPTSFLPHYEDNGNRERLSATELLKMNECGMSTPKFNKLLISAGFLEVKERKSSKGTMKPYKSLTETGRKYGVNLISDKNQKETQPYYYADTFMELFEKVT